MKYAVKIGAHGLSLIVIISSLYSYEPITFYRSRALLVEPRLEREWLSSYDIYYTTSSTEKSYDYTKKVTPLYDIFGTSNMLSAGKGILLDTHNPLDALVQKLSQLPPYGNFGHLSLHGLFDNKEVHVQYTQNLCRGFFIEANFFVNHLAVHDIFLHDLSPSSSLIPPAAYDLWQDFIQNFDAILARYHLTRKPYCATKLGDTIVLAGYTHSYQDTQEIDFMDYTLQAGILIPTGSSYNPHHIFSLPHGYNKHWGIALHGAAAIGMYEWLNLGACIDSIVFLPRSQYLYLKTDQSQTGTIKFASSNADVHKASVWRLGTYIKADHFARGFSLLGGYSWAHEGKADVVPYTHSSNKAFFDYRTVNTDPTFDGFSMHTLHVAVEYDFTESEWKYGPRITIAYNQHLKGRSLFKTNSIQLVVGLEVTG